MAKKKTAAKPKAGKANKTVKTPQPEAVKNSALYVGETII